jgi:hypothetical protein
MQQASGQLIAPVTAHALKGGKEGSLGGAWMVSTASYPACLGPCRNKDGCLALDELKAMLVVLTPSGEQVESADMLSAVARKITKKYAGEAGVVGWGGV